MTRGVARRASRVGDLVAVAAPSALGAALAFSGLGTRSIWLDEAASVTIASQHGAALGAAMAHDGGNMLAYYALLHVLIEVFGRGILVLRTPSAIAATCTVGLVAVIARHLYDRRVAAVSGVLTAVSLPLVFWGQDARAYALLVALVTASFLAFVLLVDRAPDVGISRVTWVGYVAATTLAMYMSFVALLAVAAQLAVLSTHRHRARAVLAGVVATGVLSLPLAVLAHDRGSGQLFWVPPPSPSQIGGILNAVTSSGFAPNFPLTATSQALEWVSVALVAAFACAPALGRRRARDEGLQLDPRTALRRRVLIAWLAVPIALALAESAVGQPISDPRNLLVALPPVGIVLAAVTIGGDLGGARPRGAPSAAFVGWCVVAALVALRALQLAPSYGVSPENWRAAVQYVLRDTHPGDCIAFYPEDGRMAFSYYLGTGASARRAPRAVLPAGSWRADAPYVERYVSLSPTDLARVSSSCTRLWIVASHQGQRSGTPGSVAHLERYHALEAAVGSLYPHRYAAHFGYAAVVDVTVGSR